MKEAEVQLTLELHEVNLILGALGKFAYQDFYELVGKLQRQANGQIETQEDGRDSDDPEVKSKDEDTKHE